MFEQRFIYGGKQIDFGTLEGNEIQNHATLHLLLRLNGGSDEKPWDLYYWPGLPGRGEFVRVVFEDAGVPYRGTISIPNFNLIDQICLAYQLKREEEFQACSHS